MDPQLTSKIQKVSGEFNKELTNGWFKKDLDKVMEHLEMCYRSMFKSLEEKGYYFDGLERTCPLEFYNSITRPSSSGTKEFEIAKTSFFGIRMKNYFIDPKTKIRTELKQPYMFLPFTNKHGDLYVRDSLYNLQYVLAERGPSVDGVREKTIFSRVLGFKFKVNMEIHRFYRINKFDENIVKSPSAMKLPANRFYNSRNDRRVKGKNVPTPLLAWYVFGKYGFTKAMELFSECDFKINDEETLLRECKEKDGWEIYANGDEINPKSMNPGIYHLKEPAIAIRAKNGKEIPTLGLQYAAGLLFMFSVFSASLDLDSLDDPQYWRLLIGKCSITLPPSTPPETYLRQMTEHFVSIEELADDISKERFNKFSIPVENTYEYFNYLMVNYSNLIRTYNPADLLHKELASMEFLVENMIHSANDFKFRIRNKSNITPKIINRELDFHFKLFGIDRSIRENNTILEQTGTDNPFIDFGLGIIVQIKSTINRGPGRKKDEFDPNHPGNVIDASQCWITSYQFATKPSPDCRGFLSPRICLAQGKYTSLHQDDIPYYEATKKRLQGL